MATFVWLQVTMDRNPTGSPVDFRFLVDKQWLRTHTTGNLDGESAHVRLNADGPQIEQWRAATSGFIPFFRALGGEVELDTALFGDSNWQGFIQLSVSGYGPIHKVVGGDRTDYHCQLHSGAVTVWTSEGFEPEGQFFHWTGTFPGDFVGWCHQIWFKSGEQLAAIRFGAREIQIDVQAPSRRRRSILVEERTDNRLWKLSDCANRERLQTPSDVIGEIRHTISDTLTRGHWNDTISIRDRRAQFTPARPEVYYHVSRPGGAVRELMRPDFDVVFQSGEVAARWSPSMLSVAGTNIELHDADHIAAEIKEHSLPPDPTTGILRLKWRGDGASPALIEGGLPTASCVGVNSGRVQRGFVWQYANTSAAPPGSPLRPALIRYAVPFDPRAKDPGVLPDSVDAPIPIDRTIVPDGWRLELTPRILERAPYFSKTISLIISTDSTRELELRIFSGDVRADSPPLLALVSTLADPASLPNASLLAELPDKGLGDPFAATSLTFSSNVTESTDPAVLLKLEPGSGNPALVVHADAAGSSGATPIIPAVAAFWAHAAAALVDPVPAAARNLHQTRDLISLRTIVERDFSHGSTEWRMATFRLRSDSRILENLGGDPMAMLDALTGLVPARAQLHSAMATVPWVACRDRLGGTAARQLHHRNIALEPGEFAAASQDRSIDGRPMAFANTERDFIEAVRDPFTLAVPDLSSTAAEILQWLPGASPSTSPKAKLVGATVSANLRDRFPSVVLQDGLGQTDPQTLRVLYRDGTLPTSEPTDWLTYNLRRAGWDLSTTPAKPRIELSQAGNLIENRWRRARNSSVPPLFDSATASCAAAISLPATAAAPAATWVCLGDEQGRIIVADIARPTNRRILRGGTPQASRVTKVIAAADIGGARWLLAVDDQGEVSVWKSDGDISRLAAVNSPLNVGLGTLAAACTLTGKIAFLFVNPGGATAKLVVWDPLNAPTIVATLPQVTAANIHDVSLVADGVDLLLAVAHTTGAAVALRGSLQASTWQLTPIAFTAAVSARLVSASVIGGAATFVTVENDSDCKIWTETSPNQLTNTATVTAPARVAAVAVGEWTSDPWLRQAPVAINAMLYTSTNANETATPLLPAAITGWRIPTDPANQPYRQMPGVAGPADALLAVSLPAAASGERLPVVSRPHLLAHGAEGACRLWDVDAEQAYPPIVGHEDVYDNAGTLHITRPGLRISPVSHSEGVNRPGSAAALRADARSNYAAPNTIIEYSVVPVAPGDALIRSTADAEGVTEIYLACDRLRLCRQGNLWKPESFPDDLDPGPDRPRLPFPYHRGPVGGFGMYSLKEGETEDLNYYPRLAGLPVYPRGLSSLKFSETNGSPDFRRIEEIEFEAALINPLDVARRVRKSIQFEIPAPGAGRSPATKLLLSAVTPLRVSGAFLIPQGAASGVSSTSVSVWKVVNGSQTVVDMTFGTSPFPPANTRFSLGITTPVDVGEGRIELEVANASGVTLPAVTVVIEYFETQSRVPPFVVQAIRDKSVVKIHLTRDSGGDMQVESVAAVDGSFTWTLPPPENMDGANAPANAPAKESLDGRLTRLTVAVGYEKFLIPRIGGDVSTGRLVLRPDPAACDVELLAGVSPLADGHYALVGYGFRGGREFGFETPRFAAATSSPGMLPLDLLRSPDTIRLAAGLRCLATGDLAASNSLVTADANAVLTWWDVRSALPWSRATLDGPAIDVAAGRLASATVFFASGERLQAVDTELGLNWTPGLPPGAVGGRTDWSDSEPIVALAAARDRIFVGNALGRLLCWDDFGQRKFAIDLFAGPILQLSAAATPNGSVAAAFDSTQSTIILVNGVTGAIVLEQRSNALFGSAGQIVQLALRCVGDNLLLAVLRKSDAGLWKIAPNAERPGEYLPLQRLCVSPPADHPDAIAIGSEGSSLALYYTSGTKVRQLLENGTVSDAVDSPGSPATATSPAIIASIDFAEDGSTQFLAAVAPGKPIHLWRRAVGSTTWTEVTGLTAVPSDPGQRLAVSLEPIGATWAMTVGPGDRLTDPRTDGDRIVEAFDVITGTGAQLFTKPVPAATRPGLLGPRLASCALPASHAAVCRALMPDVSVIDLRFGLKRFPLSFADARIARMGQVDENRLLLTATHQSVRCWQLDRRAALYTFSDGVDIDAIEIDSLYAAKAAGSIRLWRLAEDPTGNSAETVIFGDPDWTPRRLALRVAHNAAMVVAATQATANSVFRLEIWDVARPLATPNMRLSFPMAGEIIDVVILDETTIAVSRRESGQPGIVEILSVSAADQLPVVRWRRLGAAAANKLASFRRPGAAEGDRLAFDDGQSLGLWAPAPRLAISSSGTVDLHVPVQLLNALAGVGTISADIVPGGKALVYFATAAAPNDLLRLSPESVFRETFGFVANLAMAGADSGRRAVCLWRNIQGHVAGSLVEEVLTQTGVTLEADDDPTHPITITDANFVQLQFMAFNPDAATKTLAITTISARLSVAFGQSKLTLDIGEQRPRGDDAHPTEFFAHLTWKTPSLELQGPVRLRTSAGATRFRFVTGVFRLQPLKLSPTDSSDRDIALPLTFDRLLTMNLVGGEFRDTGPTGESLDPFYARLHLNASGIGIRLVPDIDIPFDPCLDPETSGPSPSALPEVVQLAHRQVLGSRFRHQAPGPGSTVLTATSTQPAPAHTDLWGISPIVQVGERHQILVSTVLVSSAAIASSTGTTLQTENLILLSRDDTDDDELGAIIGLHNVTAETDDQFLLDESAIDQRLAGIEAAGAIVQRILRGSGPATLRVVPRFNSLGSDPGSSAAGSLQSGGAVGAPIEFRTATPRDASGWRRRFAARYLLDDLPVDAALDQSPTAWRRFGVRDVQWSDTPARRAMPAEYAFLMSDRTAFHRMPQRGPLPSPDQVFPAAVPSAALAPSFRPQAIEFQLAPDKPGAMFHHTIHAMETAAAAPAGTDLPRPRVLVSESVADFALREPMQLVPPAGADIAIEVLKRTPVIFRQAERIHVEWKESLGVIPIHLTELTVPLVQLGDLSTPASYPKPEDVRVALEDKTFLQLIIRINEDLLEIDSRQAQFPLYDARQSAATAGELGEQTKTFREATPPGDRRPITPEMGAPVDSLSVRSSLDGLWGLATAGFRLRIWQLDAPDPQASQRPEATTNDNQTPFAAEFATRLGQQVILCSDDGSQAGLFLRRDLLTGTTTGANATVSLSTTAVNLVRFASFASAAHVTSPSEDHIQIQVEAYLACTDTKLQLWYQRSDRTTPLGPFDIATLANTKTYLMDVTCMTRLYQAAPRLDHQLLCVALGVLGEGAIETFTIDCSEPAPAITAAGTFTAENLTALAAGVLENGFVVFSGDVDGRVQCLKSENGERLKLYGPGPSPVMPVERIALGVAAGRLVIGVTSKFAAGRPRISVWDAFAESLLRTTAFAGGHDDTAYGALRSVQLAGGVHFVVAQTSGHGRLQILDPFLTPFRPPECFFVTTVVATNHDLLAPVTLALKYTKTIGSVPTTVNLDFRPWLILSDRNDRSIEYRSRLDGFLEAKDPPTNGVQIFTFKDAEHVSTDAQLRWERAGTLRVAWVSDGDIEGHVFEAAYSAPLTEKQIKPVPYSAVAPKVAAVALADDVTGPPRELWQRTALFGDAATAQGGAPALRENATKFAYEATDQETFDLPITAPGTPPSVKLLLIKYLVNGQTIGTGAEATP